MNNLIILFVLFSFPSFAFDKKISCQDFDQCAFDKNDTAIVFESESTKLGFITTSFEGRALTFKIEGKINQSQTQDVVVTIPVGGLSTDLSGRDDKMWNEILNKEKFPEIRLSFPNIVHGFKGSKLAKILILGQTYELPVELETSLTEGKVIVHGSGVFSLKDLKIPDPSIAIASVRDRFDFRFKAIIQ